MFSDVFKAYDVRGVYPEPLSESVATRIGCAAGRFLRAALDGREAADPMLQHVVVGRDMRSSSPKLAKALIEGLRAADVHVIDVGRVDTSFIYFAVNFLGTCGGIMTTASHNPPEYNGFKLSGRHATPIGAGTGLDDIKRIAATLAPDDMTPAGRTEQRDLWDAYRDHVLGFCDLPRPLKVVVDASNGMAGEMLPRLFDGVANLEIIPLNFETNGTFAHEPNPLVAENMIPTQQAVREHGADLGACFDGDADRCMITDETGAIIGCDLLGAVMVGHFLKHDPGATVAYDLRSSQALVEAITEAGGKPIRGRVGHVFMKQLLRERNAVFGAELSGHFYYRDNYYTDSGAITFATVLSILSASNRRMSQLVAPFARYHQSGELNFKVVDKDGAIARVRDAMATGAKADELDGLTLNAFPSRGWWLNLRKSNTEPLLRLNLEARDKDTLDAALEKLFAILGKPAAGH